MRKLNIGIVICMFISFLVHAVTGSISMMGGNTVANRIVSRITLVFVIMHIIISTVLTVMTFHAMKVSHTCYLKENKMFWARRISGLVIPIPLIMHLVIFTNTNSEVMRLRAFTAGRMISQILLVLSVALHVITNVRPALITLGIKRLDRFKADILLILSIIFFFLAAAFLIYYLRWAAV